MLGGRKTVVLGVAAVLVAGGVAWWATADDGEADRRAGSVAIDQAPGLFEVDDPPDRFRIDYRVEGFGGGETVVNADRLYVDRPFASRLESYDGPGIEGEPGSVQVSDLGAVRLERADGERVVVASAPAPGVSDVRIAASLPEALADGRIELGERRRVADRVCQVVRSAAGLATADLAPARSSSSYAETCIDADGLVLEEVLVEGGEVLLRRVATDIEIGTEPDGERFDTGDPTLATDSGGGFFAELVPGSRPPGATFHDAGDGPPGWERLGRYAVVPPQADRFEDETRRGERLTFVSDVFVRGVDVVVLDQGGTFGGVDPFPDPEGVAVDVDIEGADATSEAVLSYGRGGPVVVVPLEGGRFVRARTTGDPALLLDLLGSLRPQPGGELELAGQPGGG